VEGEKLLYIHDDTGVYFIRIRGDGIDTERSLKTTKRSKARELRDEFVLEQADIKRGIKKEKPVKRLRVTASLDAYEKAGFPGIRSGTMSHPGPSAARTETDACNRLREFFRPNFVDELDHNLLDTYHDWRVENVKEGSNGGRTTDLELNTLSKATPSKLAACAITTRPMHGTARSLRQTAQKSFMRPRPSCLRTRKAKSWAGSFCLRQTLV
jgi:hypothetical protein